jgi:hypothetical protein
MGESRLADSRFSFDQEESAAATQGCLDRLA